MLKRYIYPAILLALPLAGQTPQPLYRVTIVQRTTPAINYSHRAEPTKIDFRGTPLLPESRGEATVENRRGATLVDAHFSNVPPPTRFGPQYLTYVVWAISPEGRAQSIGELVLNGSDKGHLEASTPMQAFALIVTAEPYYSVSQPSDVVVMENAIRPETVGEVQQVNATYELLPRKEYTYNMPPQAQPGAPAAGSGVSMQEYEALVATYQAKNAIQIARAAGADRYAPDRLARAEQLYDQARQLPRKTLGEQVVASMREVAQIAEDARGISAKLAADDRLAREESQATKAVKQSAAEHDAALAAEQRAREEADRAHAAEELAAEQAEQAREQRQQMEADRMVQRMPPPAPSQPQPQVDNARANRAHLWKSLSSVAPLQTLDTPRGLIIVVPGSMLTPANDPMIRSRLAVVAGAVASYPGLRIEVDGNTGNSGSEAANYRASEEMAERVRELLAVAGAPAGSISVRAFGSTRPTASNQTPGGREQNRRVEIVISGSEIGTLPVWERTYSLERK